MKRLLLLLTACICGIASYSQLLTWTPSLPKETDAITITVDATKGNQGLLGYTGNVYVHTGAITNLSSSPSNWINPPFTWGSTQAAALATPVGTNKWSFTINNPRTFFNLAAGEELKYIAILFRQGGCGSGTLPPCPAQRNTDGTDMYIPIYTAALAVRLTQPPREPKYVPVAEPQTWSIGTAFTISADANQASAMKLYHNGNVVATSAGNVTTLTGSSSVTAPGNQQIVAEAVNGATTKYDTINVFVGNSPVVALPTGIQDGINYNLTGTSVTLVLRAPGKGYASIIGDFNNWTANANVMNKTPDGRFFWITLNGLTPGAEYGYQFVVDGTIKIPDPYAEKILDPNNDQFITATTYPNLKPYPTGKTTGMVGVLQSSPTPYTWAVNNFAQPDKRGLVIYELLIRDFLAAHDWKTLKDTLSYLKRLGVNAIEVMPFNEFEGNISWGYNGFHYFAPDKYYGPKNTIKEFIDSCHKNGIAVIMDIVLNHTYGPSPLKDLYPMSNNPWYNLNPPHTAIAFGDDFNHESNDTKYFFSRVLKHWMTEYKIDGYRFDFSKGLTQKVTSSDGAMSAHDPSRIAIIKNYADTIRAVDADALIILEHFADNAEEKELSENGLLLWANMWTQYQEASMGFLGNSNFEGVVHSARGWTNPHVVGFMESHDEERITYKNIKYGNSSGSYNVRDTATALKRMELNAAFLLTIPGPKMIYQFGELGYDISRCYLSTNGEGGDCNTKTDPKPIRWDYKNETRRQSVFNVYSQLNRLRNHPWYKGVFQNATIDRSLGGAFKWIRLTTANDTADLVVIGNFGLVAETGTVTFPTAGIWYDYFGNFIHTSTGTAQSFTLQPGEWHVYVNRNLNGVTPTPVINVPWNGSSLEAKAFPNPLARTPYTIEVKLPQSGNTKVELYNNVGQFVTTVYSGFLTSGTKTLNMPALLIAKGSYFLKVQTKNEAKTIAITLQ